METSGVPPNYLRPEYARRLVLAATSAGLTWLACGCSALLRSDGATFRAEEARDASSNPPKADAALPESGGLPESGVVDPRQCVYSPGTRLAAKAPGVGALFGAAMAADGNLLVVATPFEASDTSWASMLRRITLCDSNLNSLDAHGRGAVRVFDATNGFAKEELLPISGLSAVDAQLRNEFLPGLQRFGTFPTYSVAVSKGVVAVGVGGDGAKEPYRGSVRLFSKDTGKW